MIHFVDACEAERGCGAAALIEVNVTSSLESVMVIVSSFLLLAFLHGHCVLFF